MGTLDCGSDTFSGDEEHNTNNTLLLLVADALIAPVLLSSLSDVDELMVALGCRFALDLFSIAQHDWTGGPPQSCLCCASPGASVMARGLQREYGCSGCSSCNAMEGTVIQPASLCSFGSDPHDGPAEIR